MAQRRISLSGHHSSQSDRFESMNQAGSRAASRSMGPSWALYWSTDFEPQTASISDINVENAISRDNHATGTHTKLGNERPSGPSRSRVHCVASVSAIAMSGAFLSSSALYHNRESASRITTTWCSSVLVATYWSRPCVQLRIPMPQTSADLRCGSRTWLANERCA